jgi:hypothetical protein
VGRIAQFERLRQRRVANGEGPHQSGAAPR